MCRLVTKDKTTSHFNSLVSIICISRLVLLKDLTCVWCCRLLLCSAYRRDGDLLRISKETALVKCLACWQLLDQQMIIIFFLISENA